MHMARDDRVHASDSSPTTDRDHRPGLLVRTIYSACQIEIISSSVCHPDRGAVSRIARLAGESSATTSVCERIVQAFIGLSPIAKGAKSLARAIVNPDGDGWY
jgi:hypothetical protein